MGRQTCHNRGGLQEVGNFRRISRNHPELVRRLDKSDGTTGEGAGRPGGAFRISRGGGAMFVSRALVQDASSRTGIKRQGRSRMKRNRVSQSMGGATLKGSYFLPALRAWGIAWQNGVI